MTTANNTDEGNWISDLDGPLPGLMETLSQDNRLLVKQILLRDPWQKDDADHDEKKENPIGVRGADFPSVHWKQALVFADQSLQNVVLRQVMADTGSWNSQTVAMIKKKKKRNEPLEADEPPIPANFGIVTTQVLDNSRNTSSVSNEDNSTNTGNFTRIKPTSFFDAEAEVVLSSFSSENERNTSDNVERALRSRAISNSSQMNPNQQRASPPLDVILYFLRPDPAQVASIIEHIKRYHQIHQQQKNNQPLFHRLLFIPNYTSLCERILISKGLMNRTKPKSSTPSSNNPADTLSIHDLQLDLIPFDKDILSLEMPHAMKEAYIDGCPSSTVTSLSRSMMRLQDVIGTIPKIQGVGQLAEHFISKMVGMRLEEHLWEMEELETNGDHSTSNGYVDAADSNNNICDVEGMIVIDRKVDLVTPMLSPLTYEGLIDEILGMDCGFVTVDATLIEPDHEDQPLIQGSTNTERNASTEKASLALNGSDTLFAEVRNQNVEKFGSFLQNQAKALKESHSNFTNKDKDLSQIHQFVKQIPIFTKNLQSLQQHIELAERVRKITNEPSFRSRWYTEHAMLEGDTCYETLEDLIAVQEPSWRLLRLLVLQSLTIGGLKSSKYDFLRREIIQTYGFEYLFLLTNFEKMGLLKRQEMSLLSSTSPFTKLRQGLNLIHSEVSTVDPDDIAYVSSGYAPLTVRILQALISGKSREVLKELPGKIVSVRQGNVPVDYNDSIDKILNWSTLKIKNNQEKRKPVMLVFFIGGVTFMEIAALRFLNKNVSFPYEIVCCTTKIINGKTFLQSLN